MSSEQNSHVRLSRPGFLGGVSASAAVLISRAAASAHFAPSGKAKPSIVLIHGAWADASSWNRVVAILQRNGYTVYAPPNPLRGLSSDALSIELFVKSIAGPVVLVGHSYGGSVTSVSSANNPNVKALVYVDAFVPNSGESVSSLLASEPAPPKDFLTPIPFATATGGDVDLYLTPKYYGPVFASDIPTVIAAAMAVTQRPVAASALSAKAPAAVGWKTIPSWYVIGDVDKVIPPPLQLMMAQRAKSHISHVRGGHPSMIEHPEATVAAIRAAVAATT
jgi:pimeloyl-ACP methyl ester carboxylesterase